MTTMLKGIKEEKKVEFKEDNIKVNLKAPPTPAGMPPGMPGAGANPHAGHGHGAGDGHGHAKPNMKQLQLKAPAAGTPAPVKVVPKTTDN